MRIDVENGIDVVNNNGGGIYTVKATQPAREAAIAKLKIGDSITVNVSPIIATSRLVRQGTVWLLNAK